MILENNEEDCLAELRFKPSVKPDRLTKSICSDLRFDKSSIEFQNVQGSDTTTDAQRTIARSKKLY